MKTGRLSQQEKDFIDNNPDLEIEKISEELNRSRDVIVTYKRSQKGKRKRTKRKEADIVSITTADSKDAETKTQEVKQPTKAGELIARNKKMGVVVMTEAASQQSDENRRRTKMPSRQRGMIHKIKED